MEESERSHLPSTTPQALGITAQGTPADPTGPSNPCHEPADYKDRCWSVPIAMAAAAFFLLLPQSCFGIIFVQFMDKFSVNRQWASWPQNVAAMTAHLAGTLAFILERFLSTYQVVVVSAILTSLALIGSAFSPDMAWMTVTFGVLQGFGYGLFIITSTVYTLPYFDKYQAFASSMKFGTWGLAGVIGPFILSRLVDTFGLNGALLMLGALNFQTLPIIMLAKNPSPLHIWGLKSHTDSAPCDGQPHDPVTSSGSRTSSNMRPPCQKVSDVPTPCDNFSASLSQALRLFRIPGFYVFLVAAVVGDYAAVQFGTTVVDHGLDKGIALTKAQLLTTFLFSGELLGRLLLPLLADVLLVSHRALYAFSFLCMFACMTAAPHVSSFPGVVALCLCEGVAQGYGICMKYVLLADILGVESVAVSFGVFGIAAVPLSIVSPRIIGVFRDAGGSYDGFDRMLGAVNLAAAFLFGTFALWYRFRRKAEDNIADPVICPMERF